MAGIGESMKGQLPDGSLVEVSQVEKCCQSCAHYDGCADGYGPCTLMVDPRAVDPERNKLYVNSCEVCERWSKYSG